MRITKAPHHEYHKVYIQHLPFNPLIRVRPVLTEPNVPELIITDNLTANPPKIPKLEYMPAWNAGILKNHNHRSKNRFWDPILQEPKCDPKYDGENRKPKMPKQTEAPHTTRKQIWKSSDEPKAEENMQYITLMTEFPILAQKYR